MAITSRVVKVTDASGNEFEYQIQAFNAVKACKVFQKLAKILGPAFKALTSASSEEEATERAIGTLMETLDDVDLSEFMPLLLSEVTRGGQKINFDVEFMANFGAMVKLAQEVVSLNFGSLFSMLGTAEE